MFDAPKTTATGFSFGSSTPAFGSSSIGQSSFTFGAPTSTSAPSLGAAITSTTPAFGAAPTTSNAGLSFGASTPAPAVSTSFSGFGAQPKPAAQPGFSFGTTTSAATTNTGFPLGVSAPSSIAQAQPSLGLNFNTTTTGATGFGAFGSGSLFSTTTSQPSTIPGTSLFGATTTVAAAPTPSIGLGGIDVNAIQPKTSNGRGEIKLKETQVPDQIANSIEDLKAYIKQQKSHSSDVARSSARKLTNISNEIESLQQALQRITNNVENNYIQIKALRSETSKAIQNAEMAQRTFETPSGLQFDNTAPFEYFQEIVQKYEADLIYFRTQVEHTEKHIRALTSPQSLSPEDLKKALQQIHESFIALAGRFHDIHQKVEFQKELYLNLRKRLLRDNTNVFAELEDEATASSKISVGPTPFSTLFTGSSVRFAPALSQGGFLQNTTNLTGTSNNLGLGQPSIGIGSAAAASSLFASNFSSTTDNFPLQKPPVGAKRNKQ